MLSISSEMLSVANVLTFNNSSERERSIWPSALTWRFAIFPGELNY